MKIYKYLGPASFKKVFAAEKYCTFKCSRPKEFNDPYELFLTIDYQQEPGALATFRDIVGEMPQLPVTCFSRSPEVIPMWAHYGQNHTGLVLEIDEDRLLELVPDVHPDDVDYQDEPHEGLVDILMRAYKIGKPRYAYMLNRGVFSAAYYTKKTCWSYELERRVVLNEENVREVDGHLLFDIPIECVTSITAGARASDSFVEELEDLALEHDIPFFRLNIGKSTSKPFFVTNDNQVYLFNDSELAEHEFVCESCNEPTDEGELTCSWCAITDDDMYAAASSNPLRIYQQVGILDDYLKSMDEVSGDKSD